MDIVVAILIAFFVGVGLGTFVLGTRLHTIVSEAVSDVHKEYASIEDKTKSFIAAGVTKLEEIKKAL